MVDFVKSDQIICEKHGDVTSVALRIAVNNGKINEDRRYCTLCALDVLERFGVKRAELSQ